MSADLRALVKEAIAEALDLSPHSDTIDACSHRDPFEAYHMGFKDCREAVEAALDAQAGMVCVGWEARTVWPGNKPSGWWGAAHRPDETPPAQPRTQYRRIYAGPVEGGKP